MFNFKPGGSGSMSNSAGLFPKGAVDGRQKDSHPGYSDLVSRQMRHLLNQDGQDIRTGAPERTQGPELQIPPLLRIVSQRNVHYSQRTRHNRHITGLNKYALLVGATHTYTQRHTQAQICIPKNKTQAFPHCVFVSLL